MDGLCGRALDSESVVTMSVDGVPIHFDSEVNGRGMAGEHVGGHPDGAYASPPEIEDGFLDTGSSDPFCNVAVRPRRAAPSRPTIPASVEKARPIGNVRCWEALQDWFNSLSNSSITGPRLLVVWGSPGSGKTFAVRTLAARNNVRVSEFNGSDKRDANAIGEHLTAMRSNLRVPGGGHRILLLDDAHTMEDSAFARLVKAFQDKTLKPTIVILDDYWYRPARPLHKIVMPKDAQHVIHYSAVDAADLKTNASHLYPGEIDDVEKLSDAVNGDIRQFKLRAEYGGVTTHAKRPSTVWDQTERLFELGRPCFFPNDEPLNTVELACATLQEDPDILTLMISENLPRNATDIHCLADAMEMLCEADSMRPDSMRMRGGSLMDEGAALVAMAPAHCRGNRKPEVKFTQLIEQNKLASSNRRQSVSDRLARLDDKCSVRETVKRVQLNPSEACVLIESMLFKGEESADAARNLLNLPSVELDGPSDALQTEFQSLGVKVPSFKAGGTARAGPARGVCSRPLPAQTERKRKK